MVTAFTAVSPPNRMVTLSSCSMAFPSVFAPNQRHQPGRTEDDHGREQHAEHDLVTAAQEILEHELVDHVHGDGAGQRADDGAVAAENGRDDGHYGPGRAECIIRLQE